MEVTPKSNISELKDIAKKVLPQIEQVYSHSDQHIDEARLLTELLRVIAQIPDKFHLFCDPTFGPISVFCLTLFSFSNQETIEWLKKKFNPVLAECSDCVSAFTRGKCQMLQHFAVRRKVPHEHVMKFNNIISLWRSEALLPVVQGISVNNNTNVSVTPQIKTALHECLCNPQVLRNSEKLKATFDAIFRYLYDSQHPFLDVNGYAKKAKPFTAGIIYCWFEGTSEESAWSKRIIESLQDESFQFTSKNFTQDLLEEINVHFLYLQIVTNFHEALISHFWIKLTPVLELMELDLIEEYFVVPKDIESLKQSFKYPIHSIFGLWYIHFAHNYKSKPLEVLLRALKMMLQKCQYNFWTLIEPFTFHSILDITFENDSFNHALTRVRNNEILPNDRKSLVSSNGSLTDLVAWTLPFYFSLSSSKRIQMVKKVSIAFLKIVSHNQSLNSEPKALLMNSSTALLNAVLSISDEERSNLYSSDVFETTLYTKLDSRALLNNDLILQVVLKSATDPESLYPGMGESIYSVSSSATSVLSTCIDYDILVLCQASFQIYSGKKANDIKMSTKLLSEVVKHLDLRRFHDGPKLATQLLASMRNANGLLTFDSNDENVKFHNRSIRSYTELLQVLLTKFTDLQPSQLIKVLSDDYASHGFWSCIFASDSGLYQSATNMLYETFDVEGRLEGIHEMLSKDLKCCLNSINAVLSQLIKNEFFEPCPRAVRVLMDIISIFSDPINGTLANHETSNPEGTDSALLKFWEYSWRFLNMIYKATLKWATRYPYSKLENFTKDTLDTSILLINAYREFYATLSGDNSVTDGESFLNNILDTFKDMLYWLRLSDEYLLASCVTLIVKAADLSKEQGLKFNDDLVELMARYALRARKFSNKLTPQQSSDILSRAKAFNEKLVDIVAAEADNYHREKDKPNPSIESRSVSPHPISASQLSSTESKADFLQRKAMASSIVGRPRGQAKITSFGTLRPGMALKPAAPPKKPISQLELARRQLMADRKVHPPSSSVFNPRGAKQTHYKSVDDSSDESGDDLEGAQELFSLSKPKERSTPIVLDINGKPVQKVSRAQLIKQEEENMRKRLNVDMNPLYKQVLKWDYTSTSEFPSTATNFKYQDLKDEFKSSEAYQGIMEPLLLLECWQGLCAARDREDNKPFSIVIGNRTAVSDFYEIYASINKRMAQDSGITESDLIVLSFFPNNPRIDDLKADDFKASQATCLAKVCSLKNSKGGNMDLTIRIERSHSFSRFLTLRAEIQAVKVMQMTTVEREYSSLVGLPFYDLVDQILEGKPTSRQEFDFSEVDRVKTNYKLNKSQAEAVVATVGGEGFSLIQGPPGTGKTKTILGVIGYFLTTRKALPSNVIKQPTDSVSTSTEQLLQKQKVLICAPSNAAVDELVLRLKSGIYDKNGELFSPKLVRVGRSDAVSAAIKDLTLEELVERRLAGKSYEFSHDASLDKNFHEAVLERKKLRQKLDIEDGSISSNLSTEDISKIQMSIRELSKKVNELGRQRDELREQNSVNFRNRELDRRKTQARILAESDIICSTLSGSAHDILASLGVKFDTVIIDEACQCTELSSIIPLRYGGRRCIMVGDPNQLPPTVLSGAASKFKYNQSLFVRMEKKCNPYLLDVQYRMHPSISKFPSSEFYGGKLHDGPDMETLSVRPWHSQPTLGPYKFFDVFNSRQQQNQKTMSYVNSEECKVAIELTEFLLNKFEKSVDFTRKIGVISPYREQMQKMKREFRSYFGNPILNIVDFNTIDGFQGQEKEIIIISCVRADDSKSGVGFLKDFRRMNVALTRAKASMWILGHYSSLSKNKMWRDLINDARDRGCFELACSGFLNPKNTKAARLLKQYLNKCEPSNSDDYDPITASVAVRKQYTKASNENTRAVINTSVTDLEKFNSQGANKAPASRTQSQKCDNVKAEISKPRSKTKNTQGTRKKSSIFGAPSMMSGVANIEAGDPPKPSVSQDSVASKKVRFDESSKIHKMTDRSLSEKEVYGRSHLECRSRDSFNLAENEVEENGSDDYDPILNLSTLSQKNTINSSTSGTNGASTRMRSPIQQRIENQISKVATPGLESEYPDATNNTNHLDNGVKTDVGPKPGAQSPHQHVSNKRSSGASNLFIPKKKKKSCHLIKDRTLSSDDVLVIPLTQFLNSNLLSLIFLH
ncbi:LAMI_0H01640g1_1 [Lachancea mirantina]|uniref:LAMI_0H01640g1_1 n=1 Tax=Lachancea mirantina TaxID=1230905 RepID=A0A1G4KDX5_9SACH|nr:LAMI_0H01640g1_1 [Lachancea mirantina]